MFHLVTYLSSKILKDMFLTSLAKVEMKKMVILMVTFSVRIWYTNLILIQEAEIIDFTLHLPTEQRSSYFEFIILFRLKCYNNITTLMKYIWEHNYKCGGNIAIKMYQKYTLLSKICNW